MSLVKEIDHFIASLPFRQAVVSPGSRNAPILFSLNKYKNCTSVIDERSAAFIALGMAKELNEPVILSCTSGTAALNYYPAIAEAFFARVPLIILTADRPKDKVGQWDGQAIFQENLYKNHCRWSRNVCNLQEDEAAELSQQIIDYLSSGIWGPIHINFHIDEPFYNKLDNGVSEARNTISKNSPTQEIFKQEIDLSGNLLFFNGMKSQDQVLFDPFTAVVLNDITSSAKEKDTPWDAFLYSAMRNEQNLDQLRCDVLISSGTTTLSKGLKQFLKAYPPKRHYHISRFKEVGKMFGTNPIVVHPNQWLESNFKVGSQEDYQTIWNDRIGLFEQNITKLNWEDFNEFSASKVILQELTDGKLQVSNSMPIRYVSYLGTNLQVHANRGTSGIDGCTSTALGAALANEDETHFLITGDIAFLYDINAFLGIEVPKNLKLIILNNGGGGIFELIDGPEQMKEAIKFQTTNHKKNAKHLAAHYGLAYESVAGFSDLKKGLLNLKKSDTCSILEIFTDREKNKSFYSTFKNITNE